MCFRRRHTKFVVLCADAAASHGVSDHLARNLAQQPLVFFRCCCGWNTRHDAIMGEGRNRLAVGRAGAAVTSIARAPIDRSDPLPDQVAHHDDAAVSRGEVLEPMASHTLMDADLRVVIAGYPLARLVGPLAVLAKPVAGPQFAALGRAAEADLDRMSVVERHRPSRRDWPIDRAAQ